ncbi:MAG: decaprenyl-phosphate phosphoribosyltransferase [Armatimonadota bacterium]|nr:decaprenyl-phosphate phosphoribosyltransferase [Armatimonadota bacterium]
MNWLSALRVRQWTKNFLVFGGLIFAGKFNEPEAVKIAFVVFAAFCCISSAGYLVNDVVDREDDAKHPEKKDRPIASGRLRTSAAVVVAILLVLAGFGLMGLLSIPYGMLTLGLYAFNQAFYASVARRFAIFDVFVIGMGFLIRAVAGAAAIQVSISAWLLVCTFLLSLFLGFAKRKHELELGSNSRASLTGYTTQLLDHYLIVAASATLLAYSVYAIESNTAQTHPMMVLTIPFPAFGVFRYLQVVYKENGGGHPDRALVRDPWMAVTVILWVLVSLYAVSVDGWAQT